ncbi:MAG: respiratory nitrate reductase subunit gamma [Thermoplasmata archaeon]|nr:respiratory nitrate reductase subunit gamma [Thermoplasmata archaeon]
MSEGRYLKDRVTLYLIFAAVIVAFAAAVLALPYETIYVQDRAYLAVFLVTIILCVFVFILGSLYNVLLWMHGKGLTGSPEGRFLRLVPKALRFVLAGRFARAVSVFVKDALHLTRLRDRSLTRWTVHFLIMGGFAITFILDLLVTFSLDILHYQPMIDEEGWAKIWIRDFAFELAGFMVLLGLAVAAVRRFVQRPKMLRTELPDAASILFLLAVVLGGFVLEGMGIAGRIPGHTVNAEYSFLGYIISLAMPASAGDIYDQAWLVHAVMSALLIAYIPFSKLFHMFTTPIAIELDGLLPKEAGRR